MAKRRNRDRTTNNLNSELSMNQVPTEQQNQELPSDEGSAEETAAITSGVENQGIEDNPISEIETMEEAPVEEVITAVEPVSQEPIVEQCQDVILTEFDKLLASCREGTVAQQNLVAAIERYMDNMKPGKPIAPENGARQQFSLFKIIQGVVNNTSQEEFKKLWAVILAFFNEYKEGVFSDRYIFRFAEYWHHDPKDLAAFQRIINLIKITADPETRSVGLKQVDLTRTLEEGFSEEGRQKVVGFYHR